VELGKGETAFVGYDELSTEARILRYRKVSGKGGDQFQLVLDRTPFYAEGGGQVGDQGWLIQGADQVVVVDTKRENQLIVHFTKELPKDVSKPLTAQVNTQRRGLTARNHTATHLLHHALRKHLGTHVEQKGSLVAPDRLRFDISHFAKVTPEELATIEREVNAMITDDIVFEDKRNMPISEAKAMGAMALFGEKYGDNVRVVKFGPSIELCGGTHVPRTGVIGPFRIVSESALAAGIRRIEAITSVEAERMINEKLAKLEAIGALLKNPADIVAAVQKLVDQTNASGRKPARPGEGQWQGRPPARAAARPRRAGPQGPRPAAPRPARRPGLRGRLGGGRKAPVGGGPRQGLHGVQRPQGGGHHQADRSRDQGRRWWPARSGHCRRQGTRRHAERAEEGDGVVGVKRQPCRATPRSWFSYVVHRRPEERRPERGAGNAWLAKQANGSSHRCCTHLTIMPLEPSA